MAVDGDGRPLARFAMHYSADRTAADRALGLYVFAANVWGDSRDEIILFNNRGLCVYTNPRPLAAEGLYNETLYPGK